MPSQDLLDLLTNYTWYERKGYDKVLRTSKLVYRVCDRKSIGKIYTLKQLMKITGVSI